MMTPDATKHNPDPDYLRGLVEQSGMTQRAVARLIGIDERLFRMYLANRQAKSALDAPYPVQFCLEALAHR